MTVDKANQGRLNRRRGLDFERRAAKYFGGEKVPLSGALGQALGGKFSGDIRIGDLKLQCKRTKALTTQRRWLDHDGSDILIQCDPGEAVQESLIVMRGYTFKWLLEQAGLLGE